MNNEEREMDLALAEAEQENRLLRARNERLERELAGQVTLNKMAENARELGLDYEPAPVQDLPFGVGGGLVAIKTLLGRDPCVHANTAIEMIDAILKEHPVAPKPWVGLTDEEIEQGCKESWVTEQAFQSAVWWAEAKLKEKNT
jgi:hypothetical protein